MAKKSKTTKSKSASTKSVSTDFANRKELFSSPDSYKSLIYGVLTVIVLFVVGFSMVRLFTGGPKGVVDDGAVSTEQIQEALNSSSSKNYTVQEGETLWSIAEEKYGSGFEWYRIAEANKITDAANLEKGTALIIPDADVAAVTAPTGVMEETSEITDAAPVSEPEKTTAPQESAGKISGSSYVIQEGDDLWDIAVRAYGDGYKWVEIAAANNLDNPDLIHVDNTLKLPGK